MEGVVVEEVVVVDDDVVNSSQVHILHEYHFELVVLYDFHVFEVLVLYYEQHVALFAPIDEYFLAVVVEVNEVISVDVHIEVMVVAKVTRKKSIKQAIDKLYILEVKAEEHKV